MPNATIDRRRSQFVAIDVWFMFGKTNERLLEKFGPAGPLAWLGLLAAAKRAPVQGVVSCLNEHDFWMHVGLPGEGDHPPMDEFLKVLGHLKQTSRTTSGRRLDVRISHFGEWQKMPRLFNEAERMRSKRAQKAANGTPTTEQQSSDDSATETRGDETTYRESPPTVREGAPNNANGAAPVGGYAAAHHWIETGGATNLEPGQIIDHIDRHWPGLDDHTIQQLVKNAYQAGPA